MGEGRPTLQVIDGGGAPVPADRIALSLVVYERKRLDVPLSALIRVEASATQTFIGERGPVTFDRPHVEIWLTPNLQRQLREFTRDLVDQVMEIRIGERCVARPVVREPLGNNPSFLLSASDLAEAQALAAELRIGWRPVRSV